MKNFYTLLLTFLIGVCQAQYCGGSGSSECTPSGTLTEPGIKPPMDSTPTYLNFSSIYIVIQFKNWDSIEYNGLLLPIDWLRIDSIKNIPNGSCYSTNKTTNTFAALEDGCIKVGPCFCAQPGQYRLLFWTTISAAGNLIQQGPEENLFQYTIRVTNYQDTASHPFDTTQTTANPFIPYGPFEMCYPSCPALPSPIGINETNSLIGITINPNPINTHFTIILSQQPVTNTFISIINSYGRLVKLEHLTSSNTTLPRFDLPNGLYFWQISSNEKIVGRGKLILE